MVLLNGLIGNYYNDLYDRHSDFNISIPRYQSVYGNANNIPIDLDHDENVIIFGHLISDGSCSEYYFVYLASGGTYSNKTGKMFKIDGNYNLIYKFKNGFHVDITIPSDIWAQLSILYL